jgi:hypothetical protein
MLIGISGKSGHGKDLVGKIIKFLIALDKFEAVANANRQNDKILANQFLNLTENNWKHINNITNWEIRKFADKLKDIVCILLNCTREDLENREFKEKELGEEWYQYYVYTEGVKQLVNQSYYLSTHKVKEIVKLTPRLILQLLGTECGRQIINPNIWINSLFNDYKGHFIGTVNNEKQYGKKLPNWIITDLRFKNELESIKSRKGITIRVNRENVESNNHESETDLDNSTFDYVIENNSDITNLIKQIKEILIKENLIKL